MFLKGERHILQHHPFAKGECDLIEDDLGSV
jgi:hypothetical protein